MKGIIIYKGKYGATRQYADWLGDELYLPITESEDISKTLLTNYDFLVVGSSVYIGKMLIKGWLRKNVAALQGKKIFLFMVSGTPPDKKEILERCIQASVPAEIRNSTEIFFLPGRMIRKNLSWTDNLLMKIGTMFAKGPEAKKEMQMEYDDVKKENLQELTTAINKFCSGKIVNKQNINKEKRAMNNHIAD
jgi:menaquinone-dependent protoporphyrinogen IX oxidase